MNFKILCALTFNLVFLTQQSHSSETNWWGAQLNGNPSIQAIQVEEQEIRLNIHDITKIDGTVIANSVKITCPVGDEIFLENQVVLTIFAKELIINNVHYDCMPPQFHSTEMPLFKFSLNYQKNDPCGFKGNQIDTVGIKEDTTANLGTIIEFIKKSFQGLIWSDDNKCKLPNPMTIYFSNEKYEINSIILLETIGSFAFASNKENFKSNFNKYTKYFYEAELWKRSKQLNMLPVYHNLCLNRDKPENACLIFKSSTRDKLMGTSTEDYALFLYR